MKTHALLFASACVACIQTLGASAQSSETFLQGYNLGFLEMELKSTTNSDTNMLLRTLLAVTVDFLHPIFKQHADDSYRKVSLSIRGIQVGTTNRDAKHDTLFAANVTITGQALFAPGSSITAMNVSDLMEQAFQENVTVFVDALQSSNDPFLSNVTYATVFVDGAVVAAQDMDGPLGSKSNSAPDSKPLLEMWMIPLVGGAGAFLLVLCCVITCICCMTVDDDTGNNSPDLGTKPITTNGTGGVPTDPTANPEDEDTDEEEGRRGMMPSSKPPSPVKSIGSQDSSTFTYNPKSVRSFDNRTVNSYCMSHVEMDTAAWERGGGSEIHHQQVEFGGHDISAIEDQPSKRDLSLIQEGEDESACSPLCLSAASGSHSRASSGKYKSLLAGCVVRRPLTQSALEDKEKEERHVKGRNSKKTSNYPSMPAYNGSATDIADRNKGDDDDSDNSSFYGPSQVDDASRAAYRLNLSGSAAGVLSDLHDLSSEIDQYRGASGSTSSGRR